MIGPAQSPVNAIAAAFGQNSCPAVRSGHASIGNLITMVFASWLLFVTLF
jgi:hypothetical protein